MARCLARGVADGGRPAITLPVADGGDGTLDVLVEHAGSAGAFQAVRVHGPLGRARSARLGWLDGGVAVVEMAEAVGLRLLGPRRDALRAGSAGAGELITAALDGGARRIIVGVGGSASTDAGVGILVALGARVLDGAGRPVPPGGGALASIAVVDLAPVDPRLRDCALDVAVDVDSPLHGPAGAAHVFAPQKGAGPAEVAQLEAGLHHVAPLVERASGMPGLAQRPGAGAAGGAAFALAALGARIVDGAALVCDQLGLDGRLAGAALVITGEGRLDAQTAAGKAPAEVAARARAAGVPCVAVCGSVSGAAELFDATIALDGMGADPFRHARALLRSAGRQAVALVDG